MGFDQWMLAFHVLSAFALIAGLVLFWVLIVAGRNIDTPGDTLRLGPVAKVGNATVGIGMGGTILFGVYLAFAVDGYAIWDGWILADRLVVRRRGIGAGDGPERHPCAEEGDRAQGGRTDRPERRVARAQPDVERRSPPQRDLARGPADPDRHDLEARGMSVLATVRPDSWNFPLFVHVLGAMILVAGLVTGAAHSSSREAMRSSFASASGR